MFLLIHCKCQCFHQLIAQGNYANFSTDFYFKNAGVDVLRKIPWKCKNRRPSPLILRALGASGRPRRDARSVNNPASPWRAVSESPYRKLSKELRRAPRLPPRNLPGSVLRTQERSRKATEMRPQICSQNGRPEALQGPPQNGPKINQNRSNLLLEGSWEDLGSIFCCLGRILGAFLAILVQS